MLRGPLAGEAAVRAERRSERINCRAEARGRQSGGAERVPLNGLLFFKPGA